jgi:hypothetical protein
VLKFRGLTEGLNFSIFRVPFEEIVPLRLLAETAIKESSGHYINSTDSGLFHSSYFKEAGPCFFSTNKGFVYLPI